MRKAEPLTKRVLCKAAQFLFLLSGMTFALGVGAIAQVSNQEHPDSLRRTHQLGCIPLEEVRNVYTPVDLVGAVESCAKHGEFDNAIQLFFVYSVYGYFDQVRMKDPTAASAISALNLAMHRKLSARQRKGVLLAIDRLKDASGSLFKNTCKLTEQLGPPNYVPLYMLAHGMQAMRFVDDQVQYLSPDELEGLVKNVNAERLWRESLYEINRCPR